jgi:hypothetical protein
MRGYSLIIEFFSEDRLVPASKVHSSKASAPTVKANTKEDPVAKKTKSITFPYEKLQNTQQGAISSGQQNIELADKEHNLSIEILKEEEEV